MSTGSKKRKIDLTILLPMVILVAFGVMMIFSVTSVGTTSSGILELEELNSHGIFVILGFIVLIIFTNINYRIYYPLAYLIFGINILLLVLTRFTPLGITSNNAIRWLNLGFSVQTSEISKLANIIIIARIIKDNKNKMGDIRVIGKALLFMFVSFSLVVIQPSLSAALTMAIVTVAMLFMGGMSIFSTLVLFAGGVAGSLLLVIIQPYRLERLNTYLNPFEDPSGSGWQIINSIFAIASGGLTGAGFGKGIQKYFYIIEPQNDFIFACIAEEWGFFGSIGIIFLYLYMIYRIFVLFEETPDIFPQMLVAGIGTQIGIQAFMNIAVASSLIPNTGVGLPFISSGGSSMIIFMAMIGILLNISKERRRRPKMAPLPEKVQRQAKILKFEQKR